MSQSLPLGDEGFIHSSISLESVDPSDVISKRVPADLEIEWSPKLGCYILERLINITPPLRQAYYSLEEPYYSVIKGFLCSLDGYIESPNPLIPWQSILQRSLLEGPAYATYLKAVKRKSIYITWNVNNIKSDKNLDDIEAYIFKDIGDIFNFQYLPNFKKEDPKDYLESMIPCFIAPNHLDIFYSKALTILRRAGEFEIIDPREVLVTLSGSKSMFSKRKNKFHYENISHLPNFSTNIRYMKRSLINSQPNVLRDSVILSPDDLNTVKFIDLQLRKILSKLKRHIHLDDPMRISKRLKKFSEENTWFFMRDIKKEGLTKPKELIFLMIKALREITGNEIFAPSLFSDFELIIDNDTIIKPVRGHGLGMGNALTTFMQLILFEITYDRVNEDGHIDGSWDMLCLNDDFVAGATSVEDIEEFYDIEDSVMSDYALITEKEKSFYCYSNFVIAEEYNTTHDNKKDSYWRAGILRSLACLNITHAKSLINGIVSQKNVDIYTQYEEEIINYWGYEFFPHEYQYPSSFGGWYSSKLMGVCMDLLELDKLNYNNIIQRAYEASKINIILKSKTKNKKMFHSPWQKLYPHLLIDEFQDKFDIIEKYKVDQKYLRINSGEAFLLWESLRKRRSKEFLKKTPCLPYTQFILNFINENKYKTYYPLPFMIKRMVMVNHLEKTNIKDIYMSSNPLTSFLKIKNPEIEADIAERYSINFTELDATNGKISNQFRNRLKISILPNIKNEIIHTYYGVPIFKNQEDELEFLKSYINPFAIYNFANNLLEGGFIPILKEEYICSLIKDKEAVFSRLLSIKEHLFFQKFENRRSIKDWIEVMTKLELDLSDMITYADSYFAKQHTEIVTSTVQEIDGKKQINPKDARDAMVFFEEAIWNKQTEYVFEEPFNFYYYHFENLTLIFGNLDRSSEELFESQEKKKIRQMNSLDEYLRDLPEHPYYKRKFAELIKAYFERQFAQSTSVFDQMEASDEPLFDMFGEEEPPDGDLSFFGDDF